MNFIYRRTANNSKIIYIIVDYTNTIPTSWSRELVKNISDFTFSNILQKGYDVLNGFDEDYLLQHAASCGYEFAVVLSTGTEFINGCSFFNEVEKLAATDVFLVGHILDRNEAYYELHHQCYLLNLTTYKKFGMPKIGKNQLGCYHTQIKPLRSHKNIHDDYTPVWVKPSDIESEYNHKLHGWHILSFALKNNLKVEIFDLEIRKAKKYYYPENQFDFNKNLAWAYARERHCFTNFIHKSNTESLIIEDKDFEHIITPASGTWFTDYISQINPVTVVFYDYNSSALDYWKVNVPNLENVEYKFVNIDLLGLEDTLNIFPITDKKTLLNLSNIFCYEGTSMFASLSYRLYKENQILEVIPKNYYVVFDARAAQGFVDLPCYGKNLQPTDINQLAKPSWHFNNDWNNI